MGRVVPERVARLSGFALDDFAYRSVVSCSHNATTLMNTKLSVPGAEYLQSHVLIQQRALCWYQKGPSTLLRSKKCICNLILALGCAEAVRIPKLSGCKRMRGFTFHEVDVLVQLQF